jgi:hypothetical protein
MIIRRSSPEGSHVESAEQKPAPFKTVFGNDKGKALLAEVDRVSLHDAVLNVAIVWKSIWNNF